ncbi:MAG: hypothetical protein ACXIUD_11880 [Mongoliitalea sp.]
MVIKKQKASIGLNPIEAISAKGIQSKAVIKYTCFGLKNIIEDKVKSELFSILKSEFRTSSFDYFNQHFYIIIKGGSHD